MKNLILLFLSVSLLACSAEYDEGVEERKSILVLGNSITTHAPMGEWKGNWGMAATSPEKDFCGILEQTFDVDKETIAVWESDFNCPQELYKFITTKHYDYIIFKIGENVSNKENFKEELQKLLDFYKTQTTKIVLVTTVWKEYEFYEDGSPYEVNSKRDRIIRELSFENNCILVDISEMKEDATYYAWNEYEDGAIGSHPNNEGHLFIGNKILELLD